MDVLYQGFDGLDLSFEAQTPTDLADRLDLAKTAASARHSNVSIEHKGVALSVAESGARGGYAFRADTGPLGATWFFKKPNPRDPWGVRVSLNSLGLATKGLGGTRAELVEILARLGIETFVQGVSISRVDYAIDVLHPAFVLDPEHFVMHSQCTRADHLENLDCQVHGRSGRVTSVTIGKMPGRQVICYDKRAEVISRGKVAWWDIWNAARAVHGKPALDPSCPTSSRIWRVELRAAKDHLRGRWNIRRWADLDSQLADVYALMLSEIRHCVPTADGNRARWPQSDFWMLVRETLSSDLFEMRSGVGPDAAKRVLRDEHARLLTSQLLGLICSLAAVRDTRPEDLAGFALALGREAATKIRANPDCFSEKLKTASERYVFTSR